MLAHEPLVQMLVPALAALIDKVPQAAGRIATAQKRLGAAIRERDSALAADWMGKHIRDFRRGFEIAKHRTCSKRRRPVVRRHRRA